MTPRVARTSNPVTFRLPNAEHQQLVETAEELGLSPGAYARQLVIRGLSDHSTTEILAELESVHQRIRHMHQDLAVSVVAILADAGKATAEQARTWVDAHITSSPER